MPRIATQPQLAIPNTITGKASLLTSSGPSAEGLNTGPKPRTRLSVKLFLKTR